MPILAGVDGCFLPSFPQIPVRTAPKITAKNALSVQYAAGVISNPKRLRFTLVSA